MSFIKSEGIHQWAKHLVAALVTIFCLIVFFHLVDISSVVEAVNNFKWSYLIFGLISLGIGYCLRIYRWSIMLKSTGANISFDKCIAPFLGSITLNNVLPLRIGDVVRALVFPKSMGITKTDSTSSLVIERLIDLITLLMSLAIGLYAVKIVAIPPHLVASAITMAVIGGVLLIGGFLFSHPLSKIFYGLAKKSNSSSKIYKVYETFGGLLVSFNKMSRPKVLFQMLVVSIFIWAGEAGLFYFILLGMGLNATVIIALLVMSMATIATLVPSSPGYVGPFHLAAFTAISLVGGTSSQAGSYAIIVHLALWASTTLAGAIAIWLRPNLFSAAKSEAI